MVFTYSAYQMFSQMPFVYSTGPMGNVWMGVGRDTMVINARNSATKTVWMTRATCHRLMAHVPVYLDIRMFRRTSILHVTSSVMVVCVNHLQQPYHKQPLPSCVAWYVWSFVITCYNLYKLHVHVVSIICYYIFDLYIYDIINVKAWS